MLQLVDKEPSMNLPYKRIHVIINPASGKDEPILNVLNSVFILLALSGDQYYPQVWRRHPPGKRSRHHGSGPGRRYGGDGTQMEVANGLLGSGVSPSHPARRHRQRHGA